MAETPTPSSRPLEVSDEAWAEAVRREAKVRPLAAAAPNSLATVQVVADDLGLSTAQLYRLIRAFRAQPVTRSLVVTKPGPKRVARLLPDEIDRRIEGAIDAVFKKREKPTVRKLLRDIEVDCRAASLKVPSRKAVQARLDGRSPKELAKARDDAKVARQRFAPVKPAFARRHRSRSFKSIIPRSTSSSWTTSPAWFSGAHG